MEIMVIKIVFGILLGLGSAVLVLLAYLIYYKYLVQEKRCTAKTVGVVKRYTLSSKGPEHSGVFLPIVSYAVNGKEYKVTGPEYKAYIVVTKKTPLSENSAEYSTDNQVLKINRTLNSVAGVSKNPLQSRYPIGSAAEVYYDPKKPKLAYVTRYCNKKAGFWVMLLSGLATLIADLLILFIL